MTSSNVLRFLANILKIIYEKKVMEKYKTNKIIIFQSSGK